jgi:hypothetical protein
MNDFQQVGDVAAKVVNRWAWWQNALRGEFGPIHESDPQQGYYRVRRKGEPWEPVAIFYPEDSDTLVAYRGGSEVRPDDIWTWVCRNPISYGAYEKARNGGGFDDEPATAPGIGDNSGEADPFDALKIELAGESEQVADFLKGEVKTQAAADRLGIWSKRLTDIAKRADNQRVVEKEPHLAASRAVDDKWREIIADAKDWAAKAKKATEAFLIAKKREEEARARAAAEEAARLRREAEEAARAAQQAEQVDEDAEAKRAELIRQAQEAEKAAEVRNAQAGRTGAKVSLRTEKRGEIVDYDALLIALKDRAEIKELVQSLANRAAKSGFELPGMKIVEIEKVV